MDCFNLLKKYKNTLFIVFLVLLFIYWKFFYSKKKYPDIKYFDNVFWGVLHDKLVYFYIIQGKESLIQDPV